MKWILPGLIGLVMAFLWNRFLAKTGLGERIRIGFLTPIGEECIKYYIAYLFHLHPAGISVLFGLGEGLLEMTQTKSRPKVVILFVGIVTHAVFGLGYLFTGLNLWGLVFGLILHLIWNNVIDSHS